MNSDDARAGTLGLSSSFPLLASGAIIGISFIAQPAKFLLKEVARVDLVSVGSTTFHASHWCQIVVFVVLLLLAVLKRSRVRAVSAATIFLAALVVQSLVLMPPLDASLVQMKTGAIVATGGLHAAYGVLELLKISCLWHFASLKSALPGKLAWLY